MPDEPAGTADTVYSATAVLPYRDVRSAGRGLRAELRHRVAAAGAEEPDWAHVVLTGPVPVADARGRPWFEYSAVVRGPR